MVDEKIINDIIIRRIVRITCIVFGHVCNTNDYIGLTDHSYSRQKTTNGCLTKSFDQVKTSISQFRRVISLPPLKHAYVVSETIRGRLSLTLLTNRFEKLSIKCQIRNDNSKNIY